MAKLDIALKKVLGWEGGFANDQDDTGGATMKGVTIGTYTEYRRRKGLSKPKVADLKKITSAEIYDLANTMFWAKIKGDEIRNQSIANLCFDCVWGSGTGYIKIIQQVIGTTADGVFGPKSLEALNSYTPQSELFYRLWNRRKRYLEGCSTAWKYLNGWLRRLRSYDFAEEGDPTPASEPAPENVDSHTPKPVNTEATDDGITVEPAQNSAPEVADSTPTETKKSFIERIIEFLRDLFHMDMA